MHDLARLLKDAREAAGASQGQAARATGMCQQTISKYERGETRPNPSKVRRLLAYYGCQAPKPREVAPDLAKERRERDRRAREREAGRRPPLGQGRCPETRVQVVRVDSWP